MSKRNKASGGGTHPNKSQPPPVGPSNPPNRIWVELPPWAKAALREIAREDGRASTRQATIMLVDQIASRLGPARLMDFQRRFIPPASTEASE